MSEIRILEFDETVQENIERLKEVCKDILGEDKRWTARVQYSMGDDSKRFCLTNVENSGEYIEHHIKYNSSTHPFILHELYDRDSNLIFSERVASVKEDFYSN